MRVALALAMLALCGATAAAQEFAFPGARPTLGAGALLERGLPEGTSGGALAALATRWPLGTSLRSLVAGGAWRGLAAEAGVASAGDEALGWNAAGVALGFADRGAGAGVRAVARRDRTELAGLPSAGLEAGMGGWVGLGAARLWASAPQAWIAGESPPLARGLSMGIELAGGGALLSFAREAPRSGFAEAAAHTVRVGLATRGVSIWAETRDDPWRGGLGLSAEVGSLRVASQVDGHPVLAPTVRMSVGLERRAIPP